VPAQLATTLLFAAPEGGPLNLNNFRRRERGPAVKASGVAKPARIYDLRSTFASKRARRRRHRLRAREGDGHERRHDRAALRHAHRRAHAGIAGRLDALEAELERAAEDEAAEA
jgi:hypothetical protein